MFVIKPLERESSNDDAWEGSLKQITKVTTTTINALNKSLSFKSDKLQKTMDDAKAYDRSQFEKIQNKNERRLTEMDKTINDKFVAIEAKFDSKLDAQDKKIEQILEGVKTLIGQNK